MVLASFLTVLSVVLACFLSPVYDCFLNVSLFCQMIFALVLIVLFMVWALFSLFFLVFLIAFSTVLACFHCLALFYTRTITHRHTQNQRQNNGTIRQNSGNKPRKHIGKTMKTKPNNRQNREKRSPNHSPNNEKQGNTIDQTMKKTPTP